MEKTSLSFWTPLWLIFPDIYPSIFIAQWHEVTLLYCSLFNSKETKRERVREREGESERKREGEKERGREKEKKKDKKKSKK